MKHFIHNRDPLTPDEWNGLMNAIKAAGDATLTRRFIDTVGPLGAGCQTVPVEIIAGKSEGHKNTSGAERPPVIKEYQESGIVPLISKDFVLHWRDVAEARINGHGLPIAKAAAAASICARSEEKLVLFGHTTLGYKGLMTIENRNIVTGLRWASPGDAFNNLKTITELLMSKGHDGPYAAVVHPHIYAGMHNILKESSLLEIAHIKAMLTAGIFRSSLLAPRTGVVVSTGRHNLEIVIALDTSISFLGARKMNLPFRVFKAIYLRILKRDAICTF